MGVLDFLSSFSPFATQSYEITGVPASVTLAQAGLESGWGSSSLASKYYNFFGIKGEGTAGTVYLPTQEYRDGRMVTEVAGFAAYESPLDSFVHHATLLKTNERYGGVLQAKDPYDAVKALQEAGYATDPKYADKLTSIIDKYELTKYDVPAPSSSSGGGGGGASIDPDLYDLFTDDQIAGMLQYLDDTKHDPNYREKYGIEVGDDGFTVLSDQEKRDTEYGLPDLDWKQKLVKGGVMIVLIVFLLIMVILSLPLPQTQVLKGVVKGGG